MQRDASITNLVRCVFVGAMPDNVDGRELTSVLLDYRAASKNSNITGMVMGEGRDFFQVLEGSREQVDALYQQMRMDRRQHRMVKLFDEKLEQRDFSDMALAYGIAGRRVFRQLENDEEVFAKAGPVDKLPEGRVKQLMQQFAARRWRRSGD